MKALTLSPLFSGTGCSCTQRTCKAGKKSGCESKQKLPIELMIKMSRNKRLVLMLMSKSLVLMNKRLVLMLLFTWIPSSPLREDFMIQPCQSAQVHGSDRSAMKQSSEPRIYLIMKVILINSFCFVTDQSL